MVRLPGPPRRASRGRARNIIGIGRFVDQDQDQENRNGQAEQRAEGNRRTGNARVQARRARDGDGKKGEEPETGNRDGLREAGASKYESEEENRENLKRTKERERRGQTARDEEQDGVGQSRRSGKSGRAAGSEKSKAELYEEAKEKDISGRSKMSKDQLARALHKNDS